MKFNFHNHNNINIKIKKAFVFFIVSVTMFIAQLYASTCEARRNYEPSEEIESSSSIILTYDLGYSLGTYNQKNFSELNLGINTIFSPFLLWRNAVFTRFSTQTDTLYGLDTSLRGQYSYFSDSRRSGFEVFLGPGYRIINKTDLSGPFIEGGVIGHLAGLTLGIGAKMIFYSPEDKSLPAQDTLYFLVLSGSGRIN